MKHVRPVCRSLSQRCTQTRIRSTRQQQRTYAADPQTPPPSSHPSTSSSNPNHTNPPKEPSRVGAYYGTFGSPILKCFLGALFTYQVAYYAWLKFEAIEQTHDQNSEIAALQDELRDAVAHRKEQVQDGVEVLKDKLVEGVEEVGKSTGVVGKVAKGGWWPW